MKSLFVLIFCFASINLWAKDNRGLHKLNPFPKNPWVVRTFLKHEKVTINLQESLENNKEFNEYHSLIEQEVGRQLTDNTYFSTAITYGESSFINIRDASSDTRNYSTRGFREPRFSLYSRRKWAEEAGDPVLDIKVSFTPGFDNKEVGSHGVDYLYGRNHWHFKVSHGTFYKLWDFNINLDYELFETGSATDKTNSTSIKYKSYSDLMASFQAQHRLTDIYYIRGSIGLRLLSDQKIIRDNKSTSLQQGTGSMMFIGLVRKGLDHTLLLKLARLSNDYFVRSNSGNLEGNYVFRSLNFEYLRSF